MLTFEVVRPWLTMAYIAGILTIFSSGGVQIYMRETPSKKDTVEQLFRWGIIVTFVSGLATFIILLVTQPAFADMFWLLAIIVYIGVFVLFLIGPIVLVTWLTQKWVQHFQPDTKFPPPSKLQRLQEQQAKEKDESQE